MKALKNDSSLVYSTEFGQMCSICNKTKAKCCCRTLEPIPAGDGIVILKRERKGRKGKGVILISGIPKSSSELKKLAKSLKQKCASGGCVKGGTIEIQGDHRVFLEKELKSLGYTVKCAGG